MAAQHDKPSEVWILNEADSYRNLSYLAKGDKIATYVPIAPGLNMVSSDVAKQCGFDGAAWKGVLHEVRPLDLPEYRAVELAKRTGNRLALHAWSSRESRASVKAAIASKLASNAVRDGQ